MGYDEHGPAYPEPPCLVCEREADWCIRDNCPRRNPESYEAFHRRISERHIRLTADIEAARVKYRCPICGGNSDRYRECEYPGCPDGRDQPGQIYLESKPVSNSVKCPSCLLISVLLIVVFLGALIFAALVRPAHAMDHGFDPYNPTVKWFEQLKRHDYMPYSCCGKADGYTADIYTKNPDGSYDVVITDGSAIEFPDGSKRPELPNGTMVHVPANQINPPEETQYNPTGHAWLFVSIRRVYDDAHPGGDAATPGLSYCFAPLPDGS